MRKQLTLIFLLLLSINLFAGVNGSLEVIDGKKVLTIWGTHQERGYAHGYLLGTEFVDLFNDYIIKSVSYNSAIIYNSLRSLFINSYTVEEKYQIEAEAMIQGMIDNGVSLGSQKLGRDIDAIDILICTALPDISQATGGMHELGLGCSSISSWGSSTSQDSTLSGHLIITRLMDWSTNPALCQNHLLIVNIPAEEDEQKWISIAFTGFLGALSGINESGVAAFMNMGNKTAHQTGEPFYPILFTVRNGIEHIDYNQDADNTPADVLQAVQDRNRSAASIIHVVKDEGANSSPIIIECNNENGVSVRGITENTVESGNNLIATNHFRTLYEPEDCYRFSGIVDSLNRSTLISPERTWSIMENAAGVSHNLHAMQYIKTSNLLKWAGSNEGALAYAQEPTQFNMDSLFNYQISGIKDRNYVDQHPEFTLDQNYPNPFNPETIIQYELPEPGLVILAVYNILGQRVKTLVNHNQAAGIQRQVWNGTNEAGRIAPAGVYFYRLSSAKFSMTRKMLLLQ